MRTLISYIVVILISSTLYSNNIPDKTVKKEITQDENVSFVLREKDVFLNEDCQMDDSCDLTSFSIQVEDYSVRLDKKDVGETLNVMNYGTKMYASYKTKDIDSLEKFGIVNFIQGCHFESELIGERVEKRLTNSRYFFDDIVNYHHPEFVIDSNDKDPMYNSCADYPSRHYGYKWNINTGSFNDKTQKYFGMEQPINSELYISDRPGTAFFSDIDNSAKNISLRFMTCIYKTEDIPSVASPEQIDFARPIACHYWDNSLIYNHELKTFETKAELDPVCLTDPRQVYLMNILERILNR